MKANDKALKWVFAASLVLEILAIGMFGITVMMIMLQRVSQTAEGIELRNTLQTCGIWCNVIALAAAAFAGSLAEKSAVKTTVKNILLIAAAGIAVALILAVIYLIVGKSGFAFAPFLEPVAYDIGIPAIICMLLAVIVAVVRDRKTKK